MLQNLSIIGYLKVSIQRDDMIGGKNLFVRRCSPAILYISPVRYHLEKSRQYRPTRLVAYLSEKRFYAHSSGRARVERQYTITVLSVLVIANSYSITRLLLDRSRSGSTVNYK